MQKKSQQLIQSYLDRSIRRLRHLSASDKAPDNHISNFMSMLSELHMNPVEPTSSDALSVEPDILEIVSNHLENALDNLKKLRGSAFSDVQHLDFLYVFSETYFTLGNYEPARHGFQQSYEIALQVGSQAMQGRILARLAKLSIETGDWPTAGDLLSRAIPALSTSGMDSELALAQIEQAKIAHRYGEYLRAGEIYQQALRTSESINDLHSRATVLNGLGVILRMQGHFDQAFEKFQQAFVEFQKIQDAFGIADCLTNLGSVQLWRNELDEAKGFFDKAHKIAQANGYTPLVAFIYLNKSAYFHSISDFDFAMSAGMAALKRFVRMLNPVGIAKANLIFAKTFFSLGYPQLTLFFCAESIRVYRSLHIPLGRANCYDELSKILAQSGDTRRAQLYRDKYHAVMAELQLRTGDNQTPGLPPVTEVRQEVKCQLR
jgi:tetratricopeptide (TPR) repeat protein